MFTDLFYPFLSAILAVSSWTMPQPKLSYGLVGLYGNDHLVQSNAQWHGYDLHPTGGCGISSISPAHLGRLAYISFDDYNWIGPCVVVDIVSRNDAYESIFLRHEIGEIRDVDLKRFGIQWGKYGYIFFGECPPAPGTPARSYQPPLVFDYAPFERTPSFFPYPKQQAVVPCPKSNP